MEEYLVTKKKWLDEINKLAYEGNFKQASKLINQGLKRGYKLTKNNATEILRSCGPVLPLSFIKPLIMKGGIVANGYVVMAKEILNNTQSYNIWNQIPDVISGFKFIIEYFDNKYMEGGYIDYYYKYTKYKYKYIKLQKKYQINK